MRDPAADQPRPTQAVSPPAPPVAPAPPPLPPAAAPSNRSWRSRHRIALLAAIVAVLAIGSGVGIGVAAASDSSGAPSASVTPRTSPLPSTAPATGPAKAQRAVRATIVSEAGSTWTVRTRAGRTITVTVTPTTKFGTKKAPATATQFAAGQLVVIAGTLNNDTITATRIAAPASHAAPSAIPSTSTA